jgi:hypothetical protein
MVASPLTPENLSGLNRARFLSRSLLRSFGMDLKRIQSYSGLNQAEVSDAIELIKPLLQEFGFSNQISPQFVTSRFFEANIFTPHADGNSLISFEEASELLTLIFSGLESQSMFRKDFDSFCGTANLNETQIVNYICLLNVSYQGLHRLMPTLPHLVAYRDRVTPSAFGQFYYDVLRAASKAPTKDFKTTLADMSLVPHLLQYIELTFVKFDVNQDDLIDYQEAERAFPLFRSLLLTMSKDQIESNLLKDSEMFPLFCYLLYYREVPGIFEYLTRWNAWKTNPSRWRGVLVDRTHVSSILAMIQAKISDKAP